MGTLQERKRSSTAMHLGGYLIEKGFLNQWLDELLKGLCVCEVMSMILSSCVPGQHRSLGPSISKVRSLKLDSSIWSNALVEVRTVLYAV